MTAILGISAFYHDSAAALLIDGEIVAAAQEERFSRIKHDAGFPTQAIEYCLRAAGIGASELTGVAYYEKPWLKFERIIETILAVAPRGYATFRKSMPDWLRQKLFLRRFIQDALGLPNDYPIAFFRHHLSHAASAFYPSPFNSAAILTMDGVGEWETTTLGVGRDTELRLISSIEFPHSLGLLYSAFTQYAGFKVNSGEYKLMGLAAYGKPRYQALIEERLIDLREDGSFQLNMEYFGYGHRLCMTTRKFHRLFGGPPRQPDSQFFPLTCDIAASIQAVLEKAILNLARQVKAVTNEPNLVMAGGVALNGAANSCVARSGIFQNVWVPPAPGDAGAAIGAAHLLWHQSHQRTRQINSSNAFTSPFTVLSSPITPLNVCCMIK